MKIYKLPQLTEASSGGEYRLKGHAALPGGGSIYMAYGRILPKEQPRRLSRENGEEIVCLLKGQVKVICGKYAFNIVAGEAFHHAEPFITLDNIGAEEAIYISTGGASPSVAARQPEAAPSGSLEEASKGAGAQSGKGPEDEFVITSGDDDEASAS